MFVYTRRLLYVGNFMYKRILLLMLVPFMCVHIALFLVMAFICTRKLLLIMCAHANIYFIITRSSNFYVHTYTIIIDSNFLCPRTY